MDLVTKIHTHTLSIPLVLEESITSVNTQANKVYRTVEGGEVVFARPVPASAKRYTLRSRDGQYIGRAEADILLALTNMSSFSIYPQNTHCRFLHEETAIVFTPAAEGVDLYSVSIRLGGV